jgi:SAM-dependent methyltransferase
VSEERRAVPASGIPDDPPTVPNLGPSSSPPSPPSAPPTGPDGVPRRRSRMALRIPDDEVGRPPSADFEGSPPPPDAGLREPSPPPASADRGPSVRPMRIITLNPPATPAPLEGEGRAPLSEDVQLDEEPLTLTTPRQDPSQRAPSLASAPLLTTPPPAVQAPTVDGLRALAGSSESSDVRAALSEPEISVDDLVTVDATPLPTAASPDLLPAMRARQPSHPPAPPASRKPASTPARRPSKPPLVIVPPRMGSVAPQSMEGSAQRRKGRFWWEELFNDDYLRAAEKVTQEQVGREVDFIETSLGVERGGAMLDLACGTGRHAVELARRGYQLVGFDLSLAMLARSGEEAQERGAKINFVQGDMREMTFAEQFDGVLCWNTSFGFFEEEKNALVIDRIHGALKGGGMFLLDVVNRDFVMHQSPSLAWFEGDGCVCMDEMLVDFITSRMRVKRTMMFDDGRTREIEYTMRVYSLHELGKMLHDHGFKVCEVSGSTATPGVFFGDESPRTMILAEKR